MLFENPPKNIGSLIAKSADLTNKPFVHSVVKINGEYEFEDENIDLTVNILCRDKEGKRLEIYDLELELFKSNKELVLVISKLNFPDEPINDPFAAGFEPEDDPNKPAAFAMISRGKFRIPDYRGAAVGACRIEVRDLGAVEPRPTIDDVRRLDGGNYHIDVRPDSNKLVIELKTES